MKNILLLMLEILDMTIWILIYRIRLINNINMNAKFIKMDYDSIRYKPFELIKKIGEVNGYVIPSDDYPKITYGNPTNTIQELRDTPILITCGGQWCGCRFYYASWHGWNDVTVVQSIDDYLPGGHKDLWA